VLGAGLLTANGEMWQHYREGLIAGGHDPAIGRMGGGVQGYVTEDPDRDWPSVAKYLSYQVDSYRRHMVEGTGRTTPPRPVDPDKLRAVDPNSPPLASFVYGTPEEVAARIISATAGAPVETVFVFASLGGAPDEMTAEHVRTICTRLRPLLADA
jgi:hypothetical protein